MRLGVDLRCLQGRYLTGVGEYTYQTLRALVAQEPGLVVRGFASGAKAVTLPPGLESSIQIARRRLPNKLVNFASFAHLGHSLNVFLGAGSRLDCVWLPNPGFVQLSGQTPAVLTVHDLSFIHFPNFFPLRGRLWYYPAVKAFLKRAPSILQVAAVSQHTADDVAEQFPKLVGKIRVISPGVGQEYFDGVSADTMTRVRAKYKLPDRYLLTLGTIEPRKNYQLLFRAYDALLRREPSFAYDLVVAGGWGWRTRELQRIYQQLSGRHRIHIIGYVEGMDKPTLYRLARLFLYPSIFEGFGMPVLEAMAAGSPVLASHSSSLPEVVGEAGVLIDPWQPDAWVEAMLWYANDDSARELLIGRGQARARQYSWNATAGSYLKFFHDLT